MGAAEPVRVLHLTDPHLFADKAAELRGCVTYASLVAVLDHYRKSDWQANLVIATGDLVQDSSADAYAHLRRLLGELGLPVCTVPGNHDVRDLMQRALSTSPFRYCRPVETGGWLIVGLDSCVDDEVGGTVAAAELDRLDAEIAASDAADVLVCLHHPPVLVGSKWLDAVGMTNGDELLRRMRDAGRVRLALFGHVHQAYDAEHYGMRILGTPSTCRQFVQGSDEFAVDDKPPAYRRIQLHSDGCFEHELIWVADAAVH